MVKREGNKLVLSKEEEELLKELKEFELVPNNKGIFLLIDKDTAKEANHITCSIDNDKKETKEKLEKEPIKINENDLLEEKVLGIIKKEKLSELVEGKFENKLTQKEKEALKRLIEKNKVFVFKLNETYKKGVYKVREEVKEKKESEKFSNSKKTLPEYDLEKDGFVATTNLERARILSYEFKEQIEKNELRGIKTFEGIYYLINTVLLDRHVEKILKILQRKKETNLEELAKEENISTELTKIICEFLKEDGEILEKKKGKYTFIN